MSRCKLSKPLLLLMATTLAGCELANPKPSASLAHYQLEGHAVRLVVGQQQRVGSDTIKLLQQQQADLDGDGVPERIGVLTLTGGGSGYFYYVAASRWQHNQWRSAGTLFLGDRIRFERLQLIDSVNGALGAVQLSYWHRGPEQPMAAPARLRVEQQFQLAPEQPLAAMPK
ncbi:hypothetical protein [uncultured Ferrimonas sp.]|uniref:hypothetical protein n=1 Tax=uncultured Ferrimonas sp. TaxID=432640 RepID=UPI002633981E|nr:hypothetical protein [uncultured Ferrimonas sp.]